jgi:isopenicillin N synthase-like dioxygenase
MASGGSDRKQGDIPVVDFGKFLHGTEQDKKEVAGQIDDAFQNVGFVYLKNHGVEKKLVQECFEWVRLDQTHLRWMKMYREIDVMA